MPRKNTSKCFVFLRALLISACLFHSFATAAWAVDEADIDRAGSCAAYYWVLSKDPVLGEQTLLNFGQSFQLMKSVTRIGIQGVRKKSGVITHSLPMQMFLVRAQGWELGNLTSDTRRRLRSIIIYCAAWEKSILSSLEGCGEQLLYSLPAKDYAGRAAFFDRCIQSPDDSMVHTVSEAVTNDFVDLVSSAFQRWEARGSPLYSP